MIAGTVFFLQADLAPAVCYRWTVLVTPALWSAMVTWFRREV